MSYQNNTPPCGIFGWSFFCPFKCGFFKRLFHIGNCTNKKIDPIPTKTPTKDPTKAPTNAPTKAPTKAPTNAPITLTTQSLLTSFINIITLSNRSIAPNGPTPEDRALNYLIVNDTTFNFTQLLTLNSMMTNIVQFRIRQRYALLTWWFQQAFTSTTWYNTGGWLVNANECGNNWYGIGCVSINLGGTVGTQNVVTTVTLGSNGIKGTIPSDLGLLTALTYFRVTSNALTGKLPASIGHWTALTIFAVNNNALTGTIPASIGNWSQIQRAYFDDNQFTGTMPIGICSFIGRANGDQLWADCMSEIVCSLQDCCTRCL
jgi:hypothetical protein